MGLQGEVLRARGKVHEALMLFQRAMESQPSNAALTLIGTCWKQLGNSDKALRLCVEFDLTLACIGP